ncbi:MULTISPECIES: roadblock/LC7 domain-containing protein [Micromonospora]|uniref:Roadblock/LAMTOR2 domain-containing protein n=1 Tax=Micromonospora yangpuensis TaxID=683228 RepID=A0A1C6VI81_9ACTN|nr:roadblock/LC7 domain-containing protein [Micromonospora yangpuensis]GGM00231.1 dynein regulation protein LC7 [Micromonospora yangpuensis]SCL66043.1 hypothetical protein GA0070617_5942 [Micromonospora yangpuensis]
MNDFGAPPVDVPRSADDVTWLVDQFADRVPGVTHALLITSDGLLLAASQGTARNLGERLAASTSGLLSLAQDGGNVLGVGRPEALTVRYPGGHLVCMRAGDAACLMIAASPAADLGVIANEMLRLIDGVGPALTPQLRSELGVLAPEPGGLLGVLGPEPRRLRR